MIALTGRLWPGIAVLAALPALAGPAEQPLDKLLATRISTASKYTQKSAQAPASVTIVSAEEIRRYGWDSLADVMAMVRGFYISYDRNYHYVGVRGFGRETDYNNRLLLLIDGHPLNENVFGSAPFGTDLALDLDAFERIEIVRGPGSSLYGTGAMFAVVNLITRDGASLDGISASAAAGSAGRRRAAAYGGTELQGMDVTASVIASSTRGRDLRFAEYPGAVARGLDFDDYQGGLATIRKGGLRILANAVRREKGIPTGAFGADFGHPDAYSNDERALLEARWEQDLDPRRRIMLRGFTHWYRYDGIYPYDGQRWIDRGDGRWRGGEIQGRFDLRANHRLIVGAEAVDHRRAGYHFDPEGQPPTGYDMPHRVLSLYAEDEIQPLPNFSITAGFRLDHYSHLDNSVLSPRAAMIWDVQPGTTLKLVYGRAFRAPSTYELAYVDPTGGVQGNPDLGVEKIDAWQLIVERRLSDALHGVVEAFDHRIRDLVDPVASGGVLRFQNLGVSRAHGLEGELHARFDRLWMYANATVMRATGSSRTRLTNSPRVLARLGASSPIGSRWSASAETAYEGSRLTISGSEADAALLVNGRLGFKLTRRAEVSLTMRNLFDARWSTPAGYEHRQETIEQDGRTLLLKLHYGI